MFRHLNPAVCTMVLMPMLIYSCGERGSQVTMPGRNMGAEAEAQDGLGSGPQVQPSSAVKDDRFLDIVMKIKATVLGIPLCNGDLGLQIHLQVDPSDHNFQMIKVPTDTVSCFIYGKIGLKEMLEGGYAGNARPPSVTNNITESDDVINFKLLGGGLYSPARPFLPAFISASPEDLKRISVTRSVTLTEWTENNRTSTGTISARTLRYLPDVQHTLMNRRFREIYDFEFKNDGFHGANRVSTFLFDRMEIRIALKPFAILGMKLDTTINKMLAGAAEQNGGVGPLDAVLGTGSGNSGTLIGGLVKVFGSFIQVKTEGELKQMADLAPPGEEDEDDGVVTSSRDQPSGG